MLAELIEHLVLPGAPTEFERSYLARINRVALLFFAGHIPAFMLIAYAHDTNPLLALGLTSLVFSGPFLAYRTFDNPRSVSLVYGFSAMLMGGLLVHFGQGQVQIEMHFYFFALLAMLVVFGNPMAIVVAAVTVALHHLTLWWWLPSSVFNYDAPLWVVGVHAAFVVLESVATCFIARSFFDNVIGLEKIVEARTTELDSRNRDMRLVLDNASQGFLTIDRAGMMSKERSAVLSRWFGPAVEPVSLAQYFEGKAPSFAAELRIGWDAVIEDFLPLELTIDQLPRRLHLNGRHYRVDWTPILRDAALEKALVMISDVTADYERERLEGEQRDVLKVLGRVAHDKQGVLEFFEEGRKLMAAITDEHGDTLVELRRAVHTLKGNTLIFGLSSIADVCHQMESRMDELGKPPSLAECSDLRARWETLCSNLNTLLGTRDHRMIEIDDAEYEAILLALLRGDSHELVARMIADWKLELTRTRLNRIADQAQSIGKRLAKGNVRVHIEDHGLRLSPERWGSFWSAFVHLVRNAVDHGLESPEERELAGKARDGSIDLTTRLDGDQLVIEIGDDGRGIDWPAIAARARSRGLPSSNESELIEALFSDGVTTKNDVDHFSGRGIGMGAVREACRQREGEMLIHSRGGAGTRIEFRFPRSQMGAQQPAVTQSAPLEVVLAAKM